MELNELYKIKELNELDLLYKLINIAELNKKDVEKVLRGEKSAGIRVRNNLQDIKLLCEIIRDKIQIRKETKWSTKRIYALEKKIKKTEEKQIKDKELIEKRKKERILRFLK